MTTLSGHLRLRAAPAADGRTALAEQSFRTPFHIGKSYWDGGALQVRIVNATAGILAGDRLILQADVAPEASLLLTTPAASRAFVMQSGHAEAEQTFTVGTGGWLEYAPEPLFPHQDTDYTQTTRLNLDPNASACYTELLAPGRAGRGEIWAWRRLRIALEVRVGEHVQYRERLDSSGPDLGRQAQLFGFPEAWFATIVLYGAALETPPPEWEPALRALDTPSARLAPTRLGPRLWVIRCIASTSLALRDAVTAQRKLTAPLLPALHSDLRRL